MIIGYIVAGRIDVSLHDIFLGFLAGFFQVGFGFIFITIGAKTEIHNDPFMSDSPGVLSRS